MGSTDCLKLPATDSIQTSNENAGDKNDHVTKSMQLVLPKPVPIQAWKSTNANEGYKNDSVKSLDLTNGNAGFKIDSVLCYDENSDKANNDPLESYKNIVLDTNVKFEAKLNAVISIDYFLKKESNSLISPLGLNNEEFCIELGKILYQLRKDKSSQEMYI